MHPQIWMVFVYFDDEEQGENGVINTCKIIIEYCNKLRIRIGNEPLTITDNYYILIC